ncbi:unnamed protein product, partial [Symbiodinium pilosum]
MIVGVSVAFAVLRMRYPMVYSYNIIAELVPVKFEEGFFSWMKVGFQVRQNEFLG